MAASDGYINTYIDDCEGGVSGRKIATAAPKELNIPPRGLKSYKILHDIYIFFKFTTYFKLPGF